MIVSLRFVTMVIWLAVGGEGQVPPAAPASGSVSVTLPDWASAVACVVNGNADAGALKDPPGQAHTLSVACPAAAAQRLSCSGPGVEPLDVAVNDFCRSRRVELKPAIDAEVRAALPATVTVDWLGMTDKGVRLLARRSAVVERRVSLAVANLPDRVLRFFRPGASPVSVSATTLIAAKGWTLPDPQPGGELFLRIAQATVSPDAYRLTGPSTRDIARSGDSLSGPGLAPGTYALRPVYRGGIEGQSRDLTIVAGRSTTMPLAPEAIGEANIQGDVSACAEATTFTVNRHLTKPGPDFSTIQQMLRTTETTGCQWVVSGLPQGEYEALLVTPTGVAGKQAFAIEAQQIVTVALERSSVSVSGRVTYNDQPVSGAKVDFIGKDGGGHAQATTDEAGAYAVTLAGAGTFEAAAHDDSFMERKRVTLEKGSQTVDWRISGGSIVALIKTSGDPQGTTVDLHSDPAGAFWQSQSSQIDPTRVTLKGLPFGAYRISAHQAGLTSGAKTVSLSTDHPEVTVELELTPNRSTLTLRDEGGNPIHGARFPLVIPFPPEVSPGVYALESIPPGTPIRILPPGSFVPVCRIAPRDDNLDVVLSTGRPMGIQFPGPAPTMPQITLAAGSIVGMPGSECPVPLVDFQSVKIPTSPTEPSRFMIQNFPRADDLTISTRGRTQVMHPSETGFIVLQP